jgi:hypothetical protein
LDGSRSDLHSSKVVRYRASFGGGFSWRAITESGRATFNRIVVRGSDMLGRHNASNCRLDVVYGDAREVTADKIRFTSHSHI